MLKKFINMFKPKYKIVGVKKNKRGSLVYFKLSNGKVIPLSEALRLAKAKRLKGVEVWTVKSGKETLRSLPDNNKDNNLSNLPEIERED